MSKPTDKQIEDAKQVLRADYYSSVRTYAEDFIGQCRSGEIGDVDTLMDRLHESVDGSYWVIYTHANLQAMQASDNWLAIEDHGAQGETTELSSMLPAYVYYALEADILETMSALDFDPHEPGAFDGGPGCEHSACSQNYIDTGSSDCVSTEAANG
jgi:hypothetical protein